MKIDVQGAEAQVVRGAAGLLGASSECILMTEFWPYGLARCSSDALVARTHGRRYANLVGLKGKPAAVNSSIQA